MSPPGRPEGEHGRAQHEGTPGSPPARAPLQCVLLARTQPQPWRNGGGSTRELLAWPAADRWVLRLSVAHIDRDGPFSAYPGVDRWFVVLSGAGVELDWGTHQAQLESGHAPLHFDGVAAPGCKLLAGPTEDLNLMLRRDAGRGGLAAALAGQPWACSAVWRGLFTHTACTLHIGEAQQALAAGTLAWAAQSEPADPAHAAPWHLSSTEPPRAWWLHFDRSPT